MKKTLSLLALIASLFLTSIDTSRAAYINFDTDQAGTAYTGLGDFFVANEYSGVVINDSDPALGTSYVNQTSSLNSGTAINGYYVNIGAFANIQTQLTLDFATAVTDVSFDFANPQGYLNVSAFDAAGVSLGDFVYLGADAFINQAGFTMLSGHVDIMGIGDISSLLIEPNFNEALIFDNLNFRPVPLPAALPLLLSGLLGLVFVNRRVHSSVIHS